MLRILLGRARTGKSARVLEEIRALGDSSQQILLVPEHASHVAEVDVCRACGVTASRHAEVLTFKLLASRVLTLDRAYAKEILNALGKKQAVTDRDRAQIAIAYHALTLTDVYWVKAHKEKLTFLMGGTVTVRTLESQMMMRGHRGFLE